MMQKLRTSTLQLLAYILIVAVFVIGQFQYVALAGRFNAASYQRALDNCKIIDETRQVLRNVIVSATEPVTIPANASAELRQAYESGNERAAKFRADSLALLPAPDCRKIAAGD